MGYDKYNIAYVELSFKEKPLFIFINHKTAVICWAKIKKLHGILNVITFDSHGDFHYGVINREDFMEISKKEDFSSSRSNKTNLSDFKTCKEFLDWDLTNNNHNLEIVQKSHKFLYMNNDNFIDVAFMKNIVKDVYWYYLNKEGNTENGKCEDFKGKIHHFYEASVKDLKKPKENYILDIDMDFFLSLSDLNYKSNLISDKNIKKYLRILKHLAEDKKCLGITIALEPCFFQTQEDLVTLTRYFSEIFKVDLISLVKNLIKNV